MHSSILEKWHFYMKDWKSLYYCLKWYALKLNSRAEKLSKYEHISRRIRELPTYFKNVSLILFSIEVCFQVSQTALLRIYPLISLRIFPSSELARRNFKRHVARESAARQKKTPIYIRRGNIGSSPLFALLFIPGIKKEVQLPYERIGISFTQFSQSLFDPSKKLFLY